MSNSDEFDAENDLLRRYERMIQTQIDTINGIDDKAAYVARLVGILAGLVLTSLSVIATTARLGVASANSAVLVLSMLAVTAFFLSLVYAIITYLSSEFQYGPSAGIGEFMASNSVSEQEYKDVLLHGYSRAIRSNRRVVVANAKRFERCLTSFANGILLFFGVGVAIIAPNDPRIYSAVVVATLTLVVIFSRFVLRGEYLTLERESIDHE